MMSRMLPDTLSIPSTARPAAAGRMRGRRQRGRAWSRARLTIWLLIGVLLVQLLAMEFHRHSLFDIDSDCPSCQLDTMHPAPAPSAPVAVTVPVRAFTFLAMVEPALFLPLDVRPYLSPYPQAPPRHPAAQA
ncbi:MAG TPA: hypothetical protein VGN04_11440 [Herbaspirillum sp.]|jgi:hypothetical protein